jgi:hypothetical protein
VSAGQNFAEFDGAFGRAIFDEDELGGVTQRDGVADLSAQESLGVLEGDHALLGNVPVADDGNEHFGRVEVVRDFHARDGHETEPRILEFGRDQPGELALQLVVDASHAFPFHARLFRRGAAAVRFVAFFFGFACFASEAAAIDCFRICARRAAMTPTTASISSEASALLRSLRCIAGRTASLK